MAISIHAVTPSFAAEIGDVDLGRPLGADDVAAIKAAFTKYAVLVFPDQTFSDESHLDFARHFGPLETSVFAMRKDHKMRLAPQMADVGNLDAENTILAENDRIRLYQLGNRLWHTDSSFKRLPAYCSILHGRSIPPIGGQTEFADLRAAYDALPDGDEAQARRPGRLAFADDLARQARLHRLRRDREEGVRAGAAGAGAPAAGLRPHEPLSREPRRRDQRHVEGRRRGAARGADRARHAAAVRLQPSLAASTTW